MRYTWEEISAEDMKSISRDMALVEGGMPHVAVNFTYASYDVWAVDRAAHSYILHGYSDMGAGGDPLYEFFWRGKWYEVEMDEGEVLTVKSGEPVSDEERKEFRKDLRAALIVFGWYGQGPEDIPPDPTFEQKCP